MGASEEAMLYHHCMTDVMLRWLTVNHPLSSTFQTLDVRELQYMYKKCYAGYADKLLYEKHIKIS